MNIYGGDVIRSLSLNIISAGFARFWQAGLQLLLTPIIVHLLGPVAYGLVGFYGALTLFLAFLDQAVSPVVTRELGRSASRPDSAEQLRTLTRRYDASLDEVWGALTEPESIARWLARPRAFDLSAGGAYELELPDASVIAGEVREVEPGRVLELDWRYASEDTSVVRFELSEDGDGTLLVLDHRQINEVIGMAYATRWHGLLARFDRELGA